MAASDPLLIQGPEPRLQLPQPQLMGPFWNVVIVARDHHLRQAKQALKPYGKLRSTSFSHVLTLEVSDPESFLREFSARFFTEIKIQSFVSRVVPVVSTFAFASLAEFEKLATGVLQDHAGDFAHSSFHVRVHSRGRNPRLHAKGEEKLLGQRILELQRSRNEMGSVNFEDPDLIVDVETIDREAGLSIWSRKDRRAYPFLHLD